MLVLFINIFQTTTMASCGLLIAAFAVVLVTASIAYKLDDVETEEARVKRSIFSAAHKILQKSDDEVKFEREERLLNTIADILERKSQDEAKREHEDHVMQKAADLVVKQVIAKAKVDHEDHLIERSLYRLAG
jgi:hypothetical protein